MCFGVTPVGPYKLITSICPVIKTFVFNGRFAGKGDFDDGRLLFPDTGLNSDRTFRTRFGPCYYYPGVIYGNCNHNIILAFYRLTNCRQSTPPMAFEHQTFLFEMMLRENQRRFLVTHDPYNVLRLRMWNTVLLSYNHITEELVLSATQPHPKKKLRMKALHDIINAGRIGELSYIKNVTCKLKKDELAKYNKLPR